MVNANITRIGKYIPPPVEGALQSNVAKDVEVELSWEVAAVGTGVGDVKWRIAIVIQFTIMYWKNGSFYKGVLFGINAYHG